MADVESDFEEKLLEATLDDIEQTVRTELAPLLIETAKQNWQSYASKNDYEIDHIWTDVEGPIVEREDGRITIRLEWPPLTALFEWGVTPHTIEGNPMLHFYWEEIDQWIKTDEVEWGSRTGGIDESRAIRDATETLRQVMP